MAKSAYEKAIEKQQKEEEKRARKQRLIDTAKSVVSGQAMVNGMRIMDEDSETCLELILNKYEIEKSYSINIHGIPFPEHIQKSLALNFEKLKQYGMLSGYVIYIDGVGDVQLTTSGVNYFQRKEQAMSKSASENEYEAITHKEYDVFVSHANSDKLDYVDELVDSLRQLGIRIFYDKDEFSWGDNWKDKIYDGTKRSEFAIIVISSNFFDREWTEKELNEFLLRQNESGQKIILPLLYGIEYSDVSKKYPELEFIQAIKADEHTNDEITILLAKELIKRYKK